MKTTRTFVVAVVAGLIAVAPASAAPTRTVTINHFMRGCHLWQLGNGPPKVTLSATLARGARLRVENDDIMPHVLIQLSGPKLKLTHPNMNRRGASTSVVFARKGLYRFTTAVGDDYPWMKSMGKTIGKDNVLQLTLRVQ
jgi:hypothetical protein